MFLRFNICFLWNIFLALSEYHYFSPRYLSEKAMAPHSSTLDWKIPWTEEPGGLQSMGSLRVGHDWATSFSLFAFMHWRRKWQPTPVFLPGKSQGGDSLVGCCLWGRTESDRTEATQQQQIPIMILFLLALPSSDLPEYLIFLIWDHMPSYGWLINSS